MLTKGGAGVALARMKTQISGTRDGVDWPAPGETIEVPDAEAADLVRTGLAVLVEGDEETATLPDGDVETATTKRRRA